MQTDIIRLECIKLAHRHDQSPEDVIARASSYADWIGETPTLPTTLPGPDDAPKAEKNSGPGINRTSPSNGAKALK